MNDKAIISVPLNKAHVWRINCKCGGHVRIASGIINAVTGEPATCPKCKSLLSLDDILPILKSAKKFCMSNTNYGLSLEIMLNCCEEI